jgi:hypothetical protein
MKRLRKIATLLAAVVGCYFIIGLLLYRCPIGKKQRFEGEVCFKYVDLGDGSFRRLTWEMWPWGSHNLSLVGEISFHISKSDALRIWADGPDALDEQKKTRRVILTAYPVLIGGYGRAAVGAINEVPGQPCVMK